MTRFLLGTTFAFASLWAAYQYAPQDLKPMLMDWLPYMAAVAFTLCVLAGVSAVLRGRRRRV